MAKFNVGDKVRILDTSGIMFGGDFWKNGDITEVTKIENFGSIRAKITRGEHTGKSFTILGSESHAIELVSDKPTKNQRITALEKEVAELEARVAALESQPKYISNNERRKAVIAEAKAFEGTLPRTFSGRYLDCGAYACTVEYIVNTEKRTVVALLKGAETKKLRYKGIAKCAPDDVFNVDIGKAIALGRARGIDVSRFEHAVQPNEFTLGMVVISKFGDEGGIALKSDLENYSLDYVKDEASNFKIINDTDAKY